MKDFISFIREQGVVGLTIGFILGGATSKVVSSFVKGIVQPLIGMTIGSPEGLAELKYQSILYGQFLVDFIDFAIIAAIVYFIFSKLGLTKLDKKK
ncbi:MAG: MscL family protein [Candidatus Gracilibacteria bacterium]|nr:MscL family protein [Candidatus Gracilibacteria bacterium]